MTAASAERTSFGCQADNDWTFFGDALVNNALRKPQSLTAATAEARTTIAGWESSNRLEASQPQIAFGTGVSQWLDPLEARIPRAATQPVGAPSVNSLPRVAGR